MTASAGVINLLKAPGMTSHDAVAFARRCLRTRRVGHTGTLDPLAAGVLVLVVGKATRTARYFTALPKCYRVEAVFGLQTDSGDADGSLVAVRPAGHLHPERVAAAAAALTGTIEQRPPMTSAIKVGGRRLYELARRGEQIATPPRRVRVDRFRLIEWYEGEHPRALFEIHCSSGTYVRSLVTDLGQRLGTGAMAAFLVRTAVGPYRAADALTLEELAQEAGNDPGRVVTPLGEALSFLPSVTVPHERVRDVVHGRPISVGAVAPIPAGPVRLLDDAGRLLAIGRLDKQAVGARIRYEVVFARPEDVQR